jgi:predicted SnoaL-like aldol condensation-catalyzing enzyme
MDRTEFVLASVTIVALAAGCARPGEHSMTDEDTRLAARRFYETLNEAMRTGNTDLLDGVIAPKAVDHDPLPGMAPGREGIKRAFGEFRAKFPDYHGSVEDLIADGDKAACRITGRMSYRGKEVTVRGIDILRFEGGLLVDRWGQFESPPE